MSVKPEDILAEDQNYLEKDGLKLRKGSVAAFLANIKIVEDRSASEPQKQQAWAALQELVPTLKALGIPEFVVFKNSKVQALFD